MGQIVQVEELEEFFEVFAKIYTFGKSVTS